MINEGGYWIAFVNILIVKKIYQFQLYIIKGMWIINISTTWDFNKLEGCSGEMRMDQLLISVEAFKILFAGNIHYEPLQLEERRAIRSE